MQTQKPLSPKNPYVSIWLLSVISMIVLMVGIGGVTRLTGSGLSITEWKPIMGALPPLNEAEWNDAFLKYQQIPQFKVLNSSMDLSGFKFIFFWEWFHRLVGRLIGLVVLIPGLYFIFKKQISPALTRKVWFGFLLGGTQGFLGWFMVSSGLSELVYVSHFRLAAHLLLALFILAYWLVLYYEWQEESGQLVRTKQSAPSRVKLTALLFVLQMFYGALVAGLKAGYAFPTFPTMNGMWIPNGMGVFEPLWSNVFNNPTTVQFIHRWLAVLVVIFAFTAWKSEKSKTQFEGKFFLIFLGIQFLLGVLTLTSGMSLVLASAHQVNACFLVLIMTRWIFVRH